MIDCILMYIVYSVSIVILILLLCIHLQYIICIYEYLDQLLINDNNISVRELKSIKFRLENNTFQIVLIGCGVISQWGGSLYN